MADGRSRSLRAAPALALLIALLLAGLLWWRVDGPSAGAEKVELDRLAPFAELQGAPLIAGNGLGEGAPASLPWPGDGAGTAGAHFGSRTPSSGPARLVAEGANASRRGARKAAAAPAGANTFSSLDRNNDARISPAEFAVYRIAGIKPNQQGNKADDLAPFVATAALNRIIPEFGRLDLNNDWFVSRTEFESNPVEPPVSQVPSVAVPPLPAARQPLSSTFNWAPSKRMNDDAYSQS